MAGGIQPGTCATTTESDASEKRQIRLVEQVFNEASSDWSSKKSMPIEELIGQEAPYSLKKDGTSQEWKADGGFVFYRDECVGVIENKYQHSRQNACERVAKYLTCFKPHQLFLSFEGPGFAKEDGGGSTGPMIDTLRHAGATVLENVADEEKYKRHLVEWMGRIKPT